MIDYDKAKIEFDKFTQNYDKIDGQINLKLVHTLGVVQFSELIAKDLGLLEEDIELAKLIALLHDIGRFEQAKNYSNFNDYETLDHANYGIKILFDKGLIRDFIVSPAYDSIIKAAIKNHNKYEIEEGLSEKELLHAKIIRDADKTDNFRVKATEEFVNIDKSLSYDKLCLDTISDSVYLTFLNHNTIVSKERKTLLDKWISYIAFIFDYNFKYGLKYIKDNDYVNILINRINYSNDDAKAKMEVIKQCAVKYIDERISEI